MKSIHQIMSWEEFEDFPRRLGWKHEYYGGKIHVTPSPTAIVTLRMVLTARDEATKMLIRPVRPDDETALVDLYENAFCDSAEFADYSAAAFHKQALQCIREFLKRHDHAPHSASRLAIDQEQLVGAALIERLRKGPLLQPLFVRGSHQRRRIATAVMDQVVNQLIRLGEMHLFSRCHLANGGSLAWHEAFGFDELEDASIARHRAWIYREQLERCLKLRTATTFELSELMQLTHRCEHTAARLHELEQEDFRSVHPMLDEPIDSAAS